MAETIEKIDSEIVKVTTDSVQRHNKNDLLAHKATLEVELKKTNEWLAILEK